LARVTTRPLLKCLWPVLRRGSDEVQLGIDPSRAVVLRGLSEAQIVALESLDGTRELPAVLAESPGLVSTLHDRGLLAETTEIADLRDLPVGLRAALAPDADALVRTTGPRQGYAALARRRDSLVLVCGRGALPMAVATLLRRAGVGQVRVGPEAAEEPGDPALVVLTAAQAIGPGEAESWRRRGIRVLPVVMHLVEAVVGPLVAPGSPCLRCLDLTRADLDTAWPLLLGQLTRPAVGRGPEVGGETSLVAVTAALASMVALAALDGQPVPGGRSLEVALPWPGVRQRQWAVHPRCSCAADDVSGRPADARDPGQARMAG
jgi:hypothetical protein